MWLTDVSIKRPVFIIMVVLALIVLGVRSQQTMQTELTPKMDFPFIAIITAYPGAGPQEIETLVSKPTEEAVGSTPGLKNLTSVSQDGISLVGLEFELETDIETAAADVRDKLAVIKGTLPKDIIDPIIYKADISAQPVITLAMESNLSSRDQRILADKMIKDSLAKVKGVAAVSVNGGAEREVTVSIDRDRLQAYGLSIDQVAGALSAENLNVPSGSIKEGPEGASSRDYAVRTVGEFRNADEIGNIRLKLRGASPFGGADTVRLGDIATVKDTVKDPDRLTRLNGVDAVTMAVQKQSDANIVEVVDGVKKQLAELNGHTDPKTKQHIRGVLPEGTKIIVATDDSTFVKDSLRDVKRSLLEGILLVVIIVFLFLHSGRATLIVALAIPTSIVATFIPITVFGFSINVMTMLGLSLCVGILVDDSIVVLENIERHLRKGECPKEAALNGRSEIGLAAVTITLVDVVVFVPIAFMGGIVGQFFRQFGITVATATLFSLFMSFTLTPMLSSRWLKSKEQEEADIARTSGSIFTRISQGFERFYSKLDVRYRGVLHWALDNRFLTIMIGIVTLLMILGMVTPGIGESAGHAAQGSKHSIPLRIVIMVLCAIPLIIAAVINPKSRRLALGYLVVAVFLLATIKFPLGFEFMPDVDRGEFSVSIELPAGRGLGASDRIARQVENYLKDIEGMEYYMTTVGASSAGHFAAGSTGSQYAQISVSLKDRGKERQKRINDVVSELNEKTALIPGAKIRIATSGMASMGGQPIQMEITGSNEDELVRIAHQIEETVKVIPGVMDVKNSWEIGKPELRVTVDRLRAADVGISVGQIGSALRTSIEGNTDAKLRDRGDEYDIRVQLAKVDRHNSADVGNILVGNNNGTPVYLRDVAKIDLEPAPNKVERKNRQRLIVVGANFQDGYTLGNVQQEISKEIAGIPLGSSQVKPGGQSEMMIESFGYLIGAMILAIVLVYMLMGALFESFVTPLVIMLSLPQALVGALLAIIITGKSLSIVTMIGFIMLIGLVSKNAILLVDYTNTLRSRGMKRNDAVLEAGPTRLRPILMTTFAMVGGMTPTAIAMSRGSEMRAPMAIAVIGGLILSTLLTLLVIPTAYTVVDDVWEWLRRLFGYRDSPENLAEGHESDSMALEPSVLDGDGRKP